MSQKSVKRFSDNDMLQFIVVEHAFAILIVQSKCGVVYATCLCEQVTLISPAAPCPQA
jgi:hypothetical protein